MFFLYYNYILELFDFFFLIWFFLNEKEFLIKYLIINWYWLK